MLPMLKTLTQKRQPPKKAKRKSVNSVLKLASLAKATAAKANHATRDKGLKELRDLAPKAKPGAGGNEGGKGDEAVTDDERKNAIQRNIQKNLEMAKRAKEAKQAERRRRGFRTIDRRGQPGAGGPRVAAVDPVRTVVVQVAVRVVQVAQVVLQCQDAAHVVTAVIAVRGKMLKKVVKKVAVARCRPKKKICRAKKNSPSACRVRCVSSRSLWSESKRYHRQAVHAGRGREHQQCAR